MKLNNKGFTLVELLAVIVILAVVMLIGVTAVGPMMTRSRKSSLATEGLALMKAAQTAYQAEQISGGTSSKISATTDVCFSLEYLYQQGYFEKGSPDNYHGSVLVDYQDGKYTYTIWIDNNTYYLTSMNPNNYNVDNTSMAHDTQQNNMSGCGKALGANGGSAANGVYCTASGTTKTCGYANVSIK